VAGVELLRQELIHRHRDDATAVAEDDAGNLHLGQPLPAAAARRRRDRSDLEVPGTVPLGDRAAERGPLGTDAERIGGILDVDAFDHVPVTGEHHAADMELRVRRVGARGDRVCAGEELLVRHAANIWKIASVTVAPRVAPVITSSVV